MQLLEIQPNNQSGRFNLEDAPAFAQFLPSQKAQAMSFSIEFYSSLNGESATTLALKNFCAGRKDVSIVPSTAYLTISFSEDVKTSPSPLGPIVDGQMATPEGHPGTDPAGTVISHGGPDTVTEIKI